MPEGMEGITPDVVTAEALARAREQGVRTAWDRSLDMKPCPIGASGLCCDTCSMGPCRLVEDKPEKAYGICGASVSTVTARRFSAMVAQGTASHADHGREVAHVFLEMAKGNLPSYQIKDEAKLLRLAEEWGVETQGRDIKAVARDVGEIAASQFNKQEGEPITIKRAPAKRQELWRNLGMVARGGDREIVELLHQSNMGMNQDYKSLMRQVSKVAMVDGWIGSMIATELQDIMFGTPQPRTGAVNFGMLSEDHVNLVFHGHEPLLSEPIVDFVGSKECKELCEAVGAKGVNVLGICCTANEMLVRHGIPIAGSYAQQEIVMSTGAVDAMVVDVQCVTEGLGEVAKRYHTKLVSTSPKARIPGALHIEFDPHRVDEVAKDVVRVAINNFPHRDKVWIPKDTNPLIAGFSFEATKYMLGGSFRASYRPLNDAIMDGRIRGVAAVVGCDSPRIGKTESGGAAHRALVRELIANDVLVVQTGCSAPTCAKDDLLTPEAMRWAGEGLRSICEAVGIPPVLHAGACVDNSRLLVALAEMVSEGGLGEDVSDLPVAGAAPDWIDAKALAIGQYFVDYGVLVVFRPKLPVSGSSVFSKFVFEEYESVTGGKWAHAETAAEMAEIMLAHIDKKREALGINVKKERVLYDMAMRRELAI